mmetsp:Transcript_32025/g.89650  ORF Transcript_32025/g.89650 Transcript_32025/m.89650 type:complete len:199 (+) Transcript_32025:136-732(+)|eukprot:CAMPEP_0119155164 /NCGR_PEP_ID=MMETSP1310-20130426/51607_1 /TAXON_ID=464262 /ORGANISM="Genus nov. species nov., Strain RCC2339" /LENGTH=198 /DNA_ID=CAMNT_0007147751 /DNA_START=565 /DNA_END=1161 /DNA_ORIENTATION=-
MADSTRKIKLAICGPTAVGKSALTIVFLSDAFPSEYDPTIEDSFTAQKSIDGSMYLLEIIDTAGAEEYAVMQADWMRSAEGFIIVYSIVSTESFHDVDTFHDNIITFKNEEDDDKAPKIPMVLAANKCDLDSHRKVETSDGQEKAAKWGCEFLECSAKAKVNVAETFAAIVRAVLKAGEDDPKGGGGGGKIRRPCVLL